MQKVPSVYYGGRNRIKPDKKRINWPVLFAVSKILVPIAAIIYMMLLSPFFKVREVIVSGNELVGSDKILEEMPYGQNLFFVNTSELEQAVMTNIPQIQKIQIYKGIPDALKVVVEEYQGKLVWQSNQRSYLISQDGYVFEDISGMTEKYSSLPKIVDSKNLPVRAPSRVTTTSFVLFVSDVFENIQSEDGLSPDRFSIDESTVDLDLYTKDGPIIKFDTLRNSKTQMKNLKLVLDKSRSEIHEYVDLRINGWAYYK